jgi:hypothetical protein
MEEKSKALQYNRQCWSAMTTNKTFSLDFNLSATDGNGNIPALELHDAFSRFTLTLIDNSGNERKIVRFNIKEKELDNFLTRYKQTSNAKFQHEMQASKPQEAAPSKPSPAYTTRIFAGAMKDKTPAEILMEDPTKEGELLRHRDWLVAHLGTYPKNQGVIDAINDAVYLLADGLLSPAEAPVEDDRTKVSVWSAEFKSMSSGNPSTRTGAYVTLTCDFTARNPWCFSIRNSEHPFSNGEVDKKTVLNTKSGTFHMNDETMSHLMGVIERRREQFEERVFGRALKTVIERDWKPAAK